MSEAGPASGACPVKRAVAIGAGALSGWLVESATRRVVPALRPEMAALGLVVAAAIYPAARRSRRASVASGREAAGVAVATGLAVAGSRFGRGPNRVGCRRGLLALGWVGHALFDVNHQAGEGGRLPSWYPDLCAGYDVAFAAALLRP
jgi:hypothetical protein